MAQARAKLFRRFVYSVWVVLIFYCVFFWVVGAEFVFWTVLSGAVILTPLNLWLDCNGWPRAARLLFCFSCNYYIFSSSIGLNHKVSAEYYYFAAMMIPLLIFDINRRSEITINILLPFLLGCFSLFGKVNGLLPEGVLANLPITLIRDINFMGAFGIGLVFIAIFLKTNNQLKDMLVAQAAHEAIHLNRLGWQLNEAQAIAKIGSWSFDLKSQKAEWSKQMFRLFPQPEEQGAPSYNAHKMTIHADDREMWEKTTQQCVRDGKPYRVRYRVIWPDKILWIEASGRGKLDQKGNVLATTGVCQDVTDAVVTDEQLKKERAKSMHTAKLASLGEMSAGIAHEVNNPLAIILGNLPLLKKYKDDEEKFGRKVSEMEKAGSRIAKIVGGLRKFSRTTEDSIKSWQNLLAIVQESLVLTESKAKKEFVSVLVRVDEKHKIWCDEVEIEQVLVNLINNGIDAVKNNVEKWIAIQSYEKDKKIILQIIDSGTDVSEEVQQKLFQPFFTTKAVGEGTGLGLSIAKGILEQHGASIELNRSMKNTCFEISFPMVVSQT